MASSKRQRVENISSFESQVRNCHQDNPVVSLTLKESPPEFDIGSPDLLEQYLHPISKEIFLQHSFRKKALHISGQTQGRIHLLVEALHDLDPEYLLTETSSDHAFVWLSDGTKIQSLELSDPQQALALHKVGAHATYCRAPPHVEQPMVANLLRGTGFACGQYDPSGESTTKLGRGEVEVFISSGKKNAVTDWHYDFQENFTIQLSGSKRWKLQQGTVAYPLRAHTPHYAASDVVETQLQAAHLASPSVQFGHNATSTTGRMEQVTLNPGDVLYFPAGMWHQVTTLEAGVSINVSLMATNYASITCQALQHLLLSSGPEWRETVSAHEGEQVVVEKLQRLLEQLPGIVQNFAQQYGAPAILPPVLRTPFALTLVDEDEHEYQLEEEEAQDEEHENGESSFYGESDKEGMGEILGCSVIDVSSFETESTRTRPGPNKVLALNPLAWVRPVKDVTNYYSLNQEQNRKLYLICINYAGNESLESVVRFVVRDDKNPANITSNGEQDLGSREACYLHYGLYLWKSLES